MLEANKIRIADENKAVAYSSRDLRNHGAVDLSPMLTEMKLMREQLEGMEALHKTSTDIVVSADKDAVIKQIRKANFRKTRR